MALFERKKKKATPSKAVPSKAVSDAKPQAQAVPTASAQARAKTRLLRTSPRKLNELACSLRGKKVERALNELRFSRRRISVAVKKVLESAIANAETNHNMNIDDLIVSEAYVGKNLVMRRFRPRAKGRAAPIRKPFSEITIIVRALPPLPAAASKTQDDTSSATQGAA